MVTKKRLSVTFVLLATVASLTVATVACTSRLTAHTEESSPSATVIPAAGERPAADVTEEVNPGEPKASAGAQPPDQIDLYDVMENMDSETVRLFEELSPTGQELLVQLWEAITEKAPRSAWVDWEDLAYKEVRSFHKSEYGVRGLEPSAATAAAETVGPLPEPTPLSEDVMLGELESLLSGEVLDRYLALPRDYKQALAAYLRFGVSPELVPRVVAEKMAQWPETPVPLWDLLEPDRYASYEKSKADLPGPPDREWASSKALRPGEFLLSYYVYVNNTQDTLQGQRQAFEELMKDVDGDPYGPDVPQPSLDSLLPPLALEKLDTLGPTFQHTVRFLRNPSSGYVNVSVLAFTLLQTELLLLKIEPGLELPGIEAILSPEEQEQFRAFPEDIQDTVERRYYDRVVSRMMSVTSNTLRETISLPEDELLSSLAQAQLEFGKFVDKATTDSEATSR